MNGFKALTSLWGAKFGMVMSALTLVAFAALWADVLDIGDIPPFASGVSFGMIAGLTVDFLFTLCRIGLQKNRTGTFFEQVRWYADYRRHHQAKVYNVLQPRTWLPMSPYAAYERHKENL